MSRISLIAVALAAVSCGGRSPARPNAFRLQCPANVAVTASNWTSQTAVFSAPVSTGGDDPVAVGCAPGSGATFPLGPSTVTCTAVDRVSERAQCTFTVTVGPPVSVVMALGDSLTEGQNGRTTVFGTRFVDVPNAYPTKLQALFDALVPQPRVTVLNRGFGGESAGQLLARLPGLLAADAPDTLLLLAGYNDLLNPCPAAAGSVSDVCAAAISTAASALDNILRTARLRGVPHLFLSTLTPPGPVVGNSNDRRIARDAIVRLNALLPAVANTEGAALVDPYPLFIGHEADYIDTDGLHLRPAGYQVLADTFYLSILTIGR